MVLNTSGYVPIFDFGQPEIISGRAREAISGGEFVTTSGANNLVSSGANSFNPTTDLLFITDASGNQVVGVALANAGSNENISVAVGGAVISTADGTVSAGGPVVSRGLNSISNPQRLGSQSAVSAGSGVELYIGRALTPAASGGHALWIIGK